jgi:hypothetical protein
MKRIAYSLFLFPLFLISQPTLQQKIAQMVMISFTGTVIPDSIKYDIQKRGLGGIILYANNITSASQVKTLTAQLSALSSSQLLLSIDQEGGKVARLSAVERIRRHTDRSVSRHEGEPRGYHPVLFRTDGWLGASVGIQHRFCSRRGCECESAQSRHR